ncbi:MAG: VOC family protein [Gammaproteobacteria bacterium]|nr:VOC family protein [Gammaproteobacteria bacterium]
MTTKDEPLGRLDHIGIGVHSIEDARVLFEDILGAKHRYTRDHHSGDFRLGLFDLHDFCIELLEPINPERSESSGDPVFACKRRHRARFR